MLLTEARVVLGTPSLLSASAAPVPTTSAEPCSLWGLLFQHPMGIAAEPQQGSECAVTGARLIWV